MTTSQEQLKVWKRGGRASEGELDDLARELFSPPDIVPMEDAMRAFAGFTGREDFPVVCGLVSRYLGWLAKVAAVTALDVDVSRGKLDFSEVKSGLRRLLCGLETAELLVAETDSWPEEVKPSRIR